MDEIRDRLSTVADPDLGEDVVSLGLVGDVEAAGRTATVPIALGAPYSPAETELLATLRDRIRDAGYEPDFVIDVDDRTPAGRDGVPAVIAVTAGKGGVGTSTVAANLAAGMARRGASVGLLDADTRTPTTPSLLGVDDRPATGGNGPVLETAHDLELCYSPASTGDRCRTADSRPADEVLADMWERVDWSDRDYVIVDRPAGTQRAQTDVCRAVPVTATVVVTTPQSVAVDGARAVVGRYRADDSHLLGVVENMGTFVCPHCDTVHGGSGTGSPDLDVALLERVPLDPDVREPTGTPTVLGDEQRSTTALFRSLTRGVMDAVGRIRRSSHVEQLSNSGSSD
jgi:ATP-binding protein involved in chromosome partitioning